MEIIVDDCVVDMIEEVYDLVICVNFELDVNLVGCIFFCDWLVVVVSLNLF